MLIVKAIFDCSDSYIYRYFSHYLPNDLQYLGAITRMLSTLNDMEIHNQHDALNALGELFRQKTEAPEWLSNEKVARLIIK